MVTVTGVRPHKGCDVRADSGEPADRNARWLFHDDARQEHIWTAGASEACARPAEAATPHRGAHRAKLRDDGLCPERSFLRVVFERFESIAALPPHARRLRHSLLRARSSGGRTGASLACSARLRPVLRILSRAHRRGRDRQRSPGVPDVRRRGASDHQRRVCVPLQLSAAVARATELRTSIPSRLGRRHSSHRRCGDASPAARVADGAQPQHDRRPSIALPRRGPGVDPAHGPGRLRQGRTHGSATARRCSPP